MEKVNKVPASTILSAWNMKVREMDRTLVTIIVLVWGVVLALGYFIFQNKGLQAFTVAILVLLFGWIVYRATEKATGIALMWLGIGVVHLLFLTYALGLFEYDIWPTWVG